MVAVPALTGVTTPAEDTVATAVLLLLHAPPLPDAVNVIVLPTHTDDKPVIEPAVAAGITRTDLVAVALPQPEVAV